MRGEVKFLWCFWQKQLIDDASQYLKEKKGEMILGGKSKWMVREPSRKDGSKFSKTPN